MSALLVAFALALAVPLFFGSWRLGLAGLGAQSLVVLAMQLAGPHGDHVGSALLLVLDLGVVRGLATPLLLARAARRCAPAALPAELVPGDLLYWVAAAGLVALGVELGVRLYPADPAQASHAATATVEVLIGFCVIAHQRTVMGQAIGMLTIESGAVLFEGLPGAAWPLPIHVGLAVVFAGLVLLVLSFLRDDVDASPAPVETSAQVEVL